MTTFKNFLKTSGKLLAAATMTLFFTSNTFAQDSAGQEMTVKGEVLDLSCYMKSGAKGPEHKSCAAGCLKNGNPIGILGSDGKVYLVIEDHKNADPYKELKNHPAEQVSVSGTFQNRNGLPSIILAKMETVK